MNLARLICFLNDFVVLTFTGSLELARFHLSTISYCENCSSKALVIQTAIYYVLGRNLDSKDIVY